MLRTSLKSCCALVNRNAVDEDQKMFSLKYYLIS